MVVVVRVVGGGVAVATMRGEHVEKPLDHQVTQLATLETTTPRIAAWKVGWWEKQQKSVLTSSYEFHDISDKNYPIITDNKKTSNIN